MTGASDNFIDIKLAKYLGLKIDRTQKAKLAIANNSFTTTLWQVESNVKLLIWPEVNYRLSFAVVDHCMHEIILGLPFLKLHEGVIIPFSARRPVLD